MTRLFCIMLLVFTVPAWAQMPARNSGLPIPRFVSLRSEEVNVRTGPGERYPISWVYRREGLPVEIIEEFDHWRKVRDYEGSEGWIHKSMLEGTRVALITNKTRTLYYSPDDSSPPLMRAQPLVTGKLIACTQDWCRLQIEGRKGWIKKTQIWGVYKQEEFE